MNVAVAPSARSASATASAGTTCPAVPPAAITIFLGTSLTLPPCLSARRGGGDAPLGALFAAGGLVVGRGDGTRAPSLRGGHGADVGGATGGDVQQQAHRRERYDQAARAVGDKR